MTIDEAKQYIEGKARQNQVGYVPINKLNIYFERAQLEVIDELWGQRSQYQPGRPIPITGGAEVTQTVVDELNPLVIGVTLTATSSTLLGHQYTIPTDYLHLLNLERLYWVNATATDDSEQRRINIELLTNAEYNARMRSQIDYPSVEFPVAQQLRGLWFITTGDATAFRVFVTYVRKPVAPKWAFTVSGGQELYDVANSQDFELPETTHNEICEKVLSYIGVSTRDMELYQPSEQQQAKGV